MTEIALHDINALVIDERTARKAAILKWEEIRRLLDKTRTLYLKACGFCALTEFEAEEKADVDDTCDLCPETVAKECGSLMTLFADPLYKAEEKAEAVIEFLKGYMPTDGSHRKG